MGKGIAKKSAGILRKRAKEQTLEWFPQFVQIERLHVDFLSVCLEDSFRVEIVQEICTD
jgi:hypothetical protein